MGGRDQQRDAIGEADDHWTRDELHGLAQTGHRQQQQDNAGHHGHHQQAGQAVGGDDAGDNDDERARRPADLNAGPAKE